MICSKSTNLNFCIDTLLCKPQNVIVKKKKLNTVDNFCLLKILCHIKDKKDIEISIMPENS